jgi:alpha-glucoside transport system substrate-binding protein
MRIRSTVRAAAVLGAAAALTAGCLSSGGGGGGSNNTSNSIEIMYGFTGNQSDDFKSVVSDWAKNNGVTIKFSPTPDFNSLINTRVQGNQLPDIAMFPQPGIMRTIAATGKLTDLSSVVGSDVASNMLPGAVKAGQDDSGTQYAYLVSANVKNGVYYPKKAAQAAGLTQGPQTLDQLMALTNTIAATGTTPWCFGIESEAATGWPATDWVENLMVIDYGADTYNKWVNHEIPFNDPKVLNVLNQMDQLLLAKGMTNGGRSSIASSNFNTAANPMFDNPPGCYMYRQGNFVAQQGGFPDAVLKDLDNTVGVFPMPGKTAEDKPVLGGGDLAGIFSKNNDAAKKFVKFLASKDFGTSSYGASGNWISPRTDFDLSLYPNKTEAAIAKVAYSSTAFVFDGSDQMPGEVGSGSFWRDMTAWISGQEDAKTALTNIENSWPS